MKEDFLHYLWEFQKWKQMKLETSAGAALNIISPGIHNFQSGPDFFNSQLIIGEQKWAGNVEIHINSSDWYVHHHETDPSYDNVILHVVWNHDADVFRKDNSIIPVLELKSVVSQYTLHNYEQLLRQPSQRWINCERAFPLFEEFHLSHWLERLYIERLEQKSETVFQLLKESSNNWEEVLLKMLAKNFGLNVNGEAFLSVINSLPFGVILKNQTDQMNLEALFLGQAGILNNEVEDRYYIQLQERYFFLNRKFSLNSEGVIPVKYFRLRPDNFPNIRLVQLASLYQQRWSLFSEVINASTGTDLYKLFDVQLPDYWETHYTFQKTHPKRRKAMSKNFKDLLIINTLVPLKFCYASSIGKDINDELLGLMESVKAESNTIINKFNELRREPSKNALHSQALLQLKKHYCDKNQCLKCSLGVKLLQREDLI